MASPKVDTWYSRYPTDYLKDTIAFTLEEDGFYNRALDQVYINRGRIPAEPSRLQLMLRATPEQWERCRWILEKHFYRDGDAYGNKRADAEIAKALKLAKIAQENGKRGGRKPTENPAGSFPVTQQEPKSHPAQIPPGTPEGNPQKSSSPSPSPSQEEREPRPRQEPGSNPAGTQRVPSPTGIPQDAYDRADRVARLYPAKSPKDGSALSFSLDAQNHLAAKIVQHPTYPWEEHARLEAHNKTPMNGRNWVMDMPNPVALDRLRAAAPKTTAPERPVLRA